MKTTDPPPIKSEPTKEAEKSFRWSFRIGTTPIQNFLIAKGLSYLQYRVLLWQILVVDIFIVVCDIWAAVFCMVSQPSLSSVCTILTPIGYVVTSVIVFRLIYDPKTGWALFSSALTLVLTFINIIVFGVKFSRHSIQGRVLLFLSVAFFCIQLYAANVLYRYWEFVKYNYDEDFTATLRELADGRWDSMQSGSVLSQSLSPSIGRGSVMSDVVGSVGRQSASITMNPMSAQGNAVAGGGGGGGAGAAAGAGTASGTASISSTAGTTGGSIGSTTSHAGDSFSGVL